MRRAVNERAASIDPGYATEEAYVAAHNRGDAVEIKRLAAQLFGRPAAQGRAAAGGPKSRVHRLIESASADCRAVASQADRARVDAVLHGSPRRAAPPIVLDPDEDFDGFADSDFE